jgi:hypothetical protein
MAFAIFLNVTASSVNAYFYGSTGSDLNLAAAMAAGIMACFLGLIASE